jgi:hypothetical protein
MPWHTDNNMLVGGKVAATHCLPGLQFVVYLTEITDSPLQLVLGSQHWSYNHNGQYLLDQEARKNKKDLVSLTPPPGSLVILNTHLFHRAGPVSESSYTRSILLFQVDKLPEDYTAHGEYTYLNPEHIDTLDENLVAFLGFGRTRSCDAFPATSAATLELSQLIKLYFYLLSLFPSALSKKLLTRIMPPDVITALKNLVIKNRASKV